MHQSFEGTLYSQRNATRSPQAKVQRTALRLLLDRRRRLERTPVFTGENGREAHTEVSGGITAQDLKVLLRPATPVPNYADPPTSASADWASAIAAS